MGLRGAGTTHRALALTVTTTNCAQKREYAYSERIEMSYDYLIDSPKDNPTDGQSLATSLIGVGNAIAYGLAAVLNQCAADGTPIYAVELASWQEVLESGEFLCCTWVYSCSIIRSQLILWACFSPCLQAIANLPLRKASAKSFAVSLQFAQIACTLILLSKQLRLTPLKELSVNLTLNSSLFPIPLIESPLPDL